MTIPNEAAFAGFAGAGIVAGIVLLVRGMSAFRSAGRISGTSASRISGTSASRIASLYRYDTRIGQVPGVWLAGLFGWTARPFFHAAPEADGVPSARLDDEAGPP